ncbi:hypothetical protein LZ31DRAFT_328653 [Colletotrichum somersetense]|nr:hypothetical protein LZ31DRAFT_328653 [Colletotrichum somersetense]
MPMGTLLSLLTGYPLRHRSLPPSVETANARCKRVAVGGGSGTIKQEMGCGWHCQAASQRPEQSKPQTGRD